ncbi:uncharacterized protein LOC117333554 [Pecten maximus]|uniref:uncharacterized protein LOC117333554 n=1 Tax=Pecten maximus TaxID=6579 RepID=UPI0014581FF5|nr:uncharacterized protein LOC117333554 [Pecten maximus]
MMKFAIVLLGFAVSAQAFLDLDPTNGHFCLACCGPKSHGCCNTCGLTDLDQFHIQEPIISKRKVMSTKSFIDDLNNGLSNLIPDFSGPDSGCFDCCGQHPCCGDCGIDQSIFNHHYPDIPDISSLLGHHGSTPEPQSPEKGTYGTGSDDLTGGLSPIFHGPIDPMDLQPVHAYYENNGQ